MPNTFFTNIPPLTTTIASNSISNANLEQMPANTIKGNNTGSPGNAMDLTVAQVNALLGVSSGTILAFTSNGTVGGAAAEILTVPGLLATDTIIAVTQKVQGTGNLPLLGWSAQGNNTITGHWVGDPALNAVLLVAVKR